MKLKRLMTSILRGTTCTGPFLFSIPVFSKSWLHKCRLESIHPANLRVHKANAVPMGDMPLTPVTTVSELMEILTK